MGKKNKKEKKGQGKEKTQLKTEKNAKKKAKKELAEIGEDDIEQMIAEFQEQDRKKTQVIEEKCGPPSPRCNMSLTAHPDKDELIMFGGEFFTGTKMFLYNDLLFYNIKKNEWLKVTAPNGPPPRSAHQAVSLKQGGGQLWIFGGEFASPTQSQFYHYKDLWVYHLKEKRWEKINAPGGPSSRSGHRMVQCKKLLIVFGGFHDNLRDCRYFNDIYAFNVETYTWTQINASGTPPPARSACVMAPLQEQGKVLIYGGYSKEKVKKDIEVGKMHTDMFVLMPEGKAKEDGQPSKWKWLTIKHSGAKPSPRSGLSLAVTAGNRAVCFGGVFDEEENEEQIKGKFFNNMYTLELDKGKWFDLELRGKKIEQTEKKKRRRKKEKSENTDDCDKDNDDDDDDDNMSSDDETSDQEQGMDVGENDIKKLTIENGAGEGMDAVVTGEKSDDNNHDDNNAESMETNTEDVFKVTIGPQAAGASDMDGSSEINERTEVFMPCPRMNALMTVKNNHLFVYGGMFEDGDKQYTLSDFYSLDLTKLDEWNVIIENDLKTQVWEDSDSSSDDDDENMDKKDTACGGDSDSDDEEMDIDFTDAPEKQSSESTRDYFVRTEQYWISKAKEYCDSEDMNLSDKQTRKLAKEICLSALDDEKD